MKISDFENIATLSYKEAITTLLNESNHPPVNILSDVLKHYSCIDLLLEIYCELFAILPQTLSSTMTKAHYYLDTYEDDLFNNKCKFSKGTVYKEKDYYQDDLKLSTYSDTYAGQLTSLFWNQYPHKRNAKKESTPMLATYNSMVSIIIIHKWKYLPFNARYLYNDYRYENMDISNQDFIYYFFLDTIKFDNDMEEIIHSYLTDHFFNIDLFSQFVNLTKKVGISKTGYVKHLDSCINTLAPLFRVLQTLPTRHLKYYCLNLYVTYSHDYILLRKKPPIPVSEYIQNLINEICYFSYTDYPQIKKLFIENFMKHYFELYPNTENEYCDFESVLTQNKNILKNILYNNRKYLLSSKTNFADIMINNLKYIDSTLLNGIAKNFFSFIPYQNNYSTNPKFPKHNK